MAEDNDDSQKTQEPTDKKMADARKKGNVPMSKDVGIMTGIFSLMIIAAFILPGQAKDFTSVLGSFISNPSAFEIGEGDAGLSDLGEAIMPLFWDLMGLMAPVFVLMLLAAIAAVVIQGEVVVALERIKAKGSNISPLSGLKRIYSVSALIEFIKSMVKVSIIFIITGYILWEEMLATAVQLGTLPIAVPELITKEVVQLLVYVFCLMIAISIFDVIWKRFEWRKKLRMSFRELKEEFKQSEGDPLIKAKLDEIRKRKARERMMQQVPKANVVIVNPTHYAVAFKYERGVDQAPVCVAKGIDEVALRIRKVAFENNVPVIENKPLARALYAVVELDKVLPFEHWKPVAEIISYVLALSMGEKKRKAPSGSALIPKE